MVGPSTDTKPDTTSENTFFLEENTGKVYYFSEGQWAEAPSSVGNFISNLLGGGNSGGGDVTPAAVADAIGDMSAEQIGAVVSDLDVVPNPVKVTVSDTSYTCAAQDNRIYSCGELTSLTIVDSGQNISFTVDFTSGSTATVLDVPLDYKAPGGDLAPDASQSYELSVRNGKAVLTPFEAVSA
jgi:hypothetical protein